VNTKQPRLALPPLAIDELTASIREHGVLQPIIVRPTEPGSYEIVAGERRWRAVLSLGLPMIPAIVEAMSDEIALEVAIIENLQREDLSPLDEAAIFARMTANSATASASWPSASARTRATSRIAYASSMHQQTSARWLRNAPTPSATRMSS
jgi:ParB family chromosome partitioning protein